MTTRVYTQQEIYNIIKTAIEIRDSDYSDFNDGSMLDILSGAFSIGANEVLELIISEFKKTYFETSHGPEVTGDVDDLQNLAVDRYGDDFKRPSAVKSSTEVTFSRPNTDEGNVNIPSGTVVKTEKDSSGEEVLFVTTEEVDLIGLTISASVEASVAGASGNVQALKINVIDSPLTDSSVVVSNPATAAGGANAQDDATYRETIRNLIQTLEGATKSAVEGAILSLASVSIATLIERERIVIDYDIAGEQILAGSSFFRIPYPVAYVADENGASSQAMIDEVIETLKGVRACGVKIEVLGALAVSLNWDAAYTLNLSGPNFTELQSDFSKITDTMADYIRNLDIGDSFIRTEANNYILSIWGPSGTGDIDSFNTNSPVANVSVDSNQKIIPAIMSINGTVC